MFNYNSFVHDLYSATAQDLSPPPPSIVLYLAPFHLSCVVKFSPINFLKTCLNEQAGWNEI